jgi:uncharacterized lipoprotein YehR (DUF1307 family)
MRFFKSMIALMLVLSFTFAFTACGDSAATTDTATETTEEMAAETVAEMAMDTAMEMTVDTATEMAVETAAEVSHGEGKEFTSAYVCPMHCADSGSDEAGECQVCGMAYVALAEHTGNDHKH